LALVAVGFVYGVFHALGPCHDKMVITGYMLANKRSIRRGMTINVLASLLQAVTAMVLVLGLFYLLGFARAQAEHIASLMEAGSFVFVAFLGAAQIIRSTREMMHAGHVHNEHCNHAHMPDAARVEKAQGFRDLTIMTISLGIRPCSGAVLLLVFACILGTIGAGIAATFAMAIGSAFTTAVLALTAVQSKNWALKFFKFSENDLTRTHAVLGIIGGVVIALMGAFFAYATIRAEMPVASETQAITAYHHPLMGSPQ
jgi:ABC-type nickel/cobalt efflux system permease component RcnA